MEIKIKCGCGTKYKFDVEPVRGRMPVPAVCPSCGANGTTDANQFIAAHLPAEPVTRTWTPIPSGQTPAVAIAPPMTATEAPSAASRLRISLPGREAAGAVADSELAAPLPLHARSAPLSGNRSLLDRTTFFIKERVAVLKLTDTYDILDPASGQPIGIAREEPPTWAKWLRLAVDKQRLPTAINIYETQGAPPVVSIRRGFTFLRSKINVIGGDGRPLGYFKSKLLSIGGGFYVFDTQDNQVAEVKGNWKGWDFRFLNKHGREIGTVTKKWAGLGKELFSSADNYIISLTDMSSASSEASALLLAAGLSIDIVYNEGE